MDENWDRNKAILHYGACITLTFAEGAYVVSSGFIDDTLHLHVFTLSSDTDFITAEFRVLPSVSYVVQGEVLSCLRKSGKGMSTEARQRITALDENLEAELKTNINSYSKLKGEPVKFGSVVQFEHISSHKYITVNGRENAEREKDNLKISMQDFSDEHSLFKIEAVYQFQREGDGNIRFGDKVRLAVMVPELNKYAYLHCSSLPYEKGPFNALRNYTLSKPRDQDASPQADDQEINGSIESPSEWQIMLFMPYIKENSDCVCVGDHVWLTQSEAEMCLTATLQPDGTAYVGFTKNQYDSNGMWKIEAETYKMGGFIELGVGFRLRHISSGWYLGGSTAAQTKVKKNRITSLIANSLKLKKTTQRLILVRHSEESTLWRFKPINARKKSKYLLRDEYFKIEHVSSKTFLHNSELNDEVFPTLNGGELEGSIFKISRSEHSIVWETLFLIHSLPILEHFPVFMKYQRTEKLPAEMIAKNREFKRYVTLLRKCMENLTLFCRNKLQSMMSLNHKYGQVESSRQNILREQHFLDALGDILQHAFTGAFELKRVAKLLLDKLNEKEGGEKYQANYNPNVYTKLLSIEYTPTQQMARLQLDFERSQIKDIADIAEQTYDLISIICTENRDNKKIAFKMFPVIQQHAPFLRNASLCMQGIVQDNEELLILLHKADGSESGLIEILASEREESVIKYFAYLLRVRTMQRYSSERRPALLRFLRAICTYNGQGISVNQEKVHEQLFNNPDTYSKTIITTTTMEDRKRLFVFFKSADGVGEQSVPLDACFIDGQVVAYHKELDYFKEMLELFAAMCCSRNYVCTETIRNWFPITAVQSNMWNANISLSLRAVFCKLMLTIYIDSYPREKLKRPEMCRIFQKQDELVSRKREVDMRLGLASETGHEIRKTALNISAAVVRGGLSKGTFGGAIGTLVSSMVESEKQPDGEDEIKFDSDNTTMLELKEAILDYFNAMDDDSQPTEFSYNLLKVAHQMALFGLFGIEFTDFANKKCILSPNHKSYDRGNMDLARLLKAIQRILTRSQSYEYHTADTAATAHSTQSSSKPKSKRKAFTYKSLIAQVMKDPFSLADPIVRGAVNLRNYVESVLLKPGKDEEDGSYDLEMKIEVCKVYDYAVDCRLDYLLSNVVEWFVQNQEVEITPKAVKELFPPILHMKYLETTEMFWVHRTSPFKKMLMLEVPDLDELLEAGGRVLADLVTIFMRSKRYQLQTLVISLIIRLYSQRKELLGRLAELHVVTHEDDIEIYKWTKQNIITFKQQWK